jgi:hypothetical protein
VVPYSSFLILATKRLTQWGSTRWRLCDPT